MTLNLCDVTGDVTLDTGLRWQPVLNLTRLLYQDNFIVSFPDESNFQKFCSSIAIRNSTFSINNDRCRDASFSPLTQTKITGHISILCHLRRHCQKIEHRNLAGYIVYLKMLSLTYDTSNDERE